MQRPDWHHSISGHIENGTSQTEALTPSWGLYITERGERGCAGWRGGEGRGGGTDRVWSFCVTSVQLRLSVGRTAVHVPASIGTHRWVALQIQHNLWLWQHRECDKERQSSLKCKMLCRCGAHKSAWPSPCSAAWPSAGTFLDVIP